MREEGNRVEQGLQAWSEKEQHIAGLFSPHALRTRYFEKLRLDHLRELRNNIKNPTKDEKLMLRMLKGEASRLEKRLYPSRLVRISVNLFRAIGKALRPTMNVEAEKPFINIAPNNHQQEQKSKLEVAHKQRVQPKMVVKQRQSQNKGLRM